MKEIVTVSLVEREGIRQLDWKTDQAKIGDLDQLISILGQLRETLVPPVRQSDPVDGEVVTMAPDPRWRLTTTLDDQLVLQLRHPGYGWLSFQFPGQSEDAILLLLQKRQLLKQEPPGLAN